MGFVVTTLIFAVVGVVASLLVRICCSRGPSTNLYCLFSSLFDVFRYNLQIFLLNPIQRSELFLIEMLRLLMGLIKRITLVDGSYREFSLDNNLEWSI